MDSKQDYESTARGAARGYILETFAVTQAAQKRFIETQLEALIDAAGVVHESLKNGGRVLICGNGGSASDAQHMAAEMVGRMLVERRPLSALALTTDTSIITAVANDYDYESIFSKQVEALGRAGDVLIAISTSGNSKNVIKAVDVARQNKLKVVSFTGGSGGKLKALSDVNLNVELAPNSSRVQETHLFIEHSIVDVVDRFFFKF